MVGGGLLAADGQGRPHLSGALGAALLDLYVREGWLLRVPRSRVVSVTPKEQAAFADLLAPAAGSGKKKAAKTGGRSV